MVKHLHSLQFCVWRCIHFIWDCIALHSTFLICVAKEYNNNKTNNRAMSVRCNTISSSKLAKRNRLDAQHNRNENSERDGGRQRESERKKEKNGVIYILWYFIWRLFLVKMQRVFADGQQLTPLCAESFFPSLPPFCAWHVLIVLMLLPYETKQICIIFWAWVNDRISIQVIVNRLQTWKMFVSIEKGALLW